MGIKPLPVHKPGVSGSAGLILIALHATHFDCGGLVRQVSAITLGLQLNWRVLTSPSTRLNQGFERERLVRDGRMPTDAPRDR